MFIREAKGFFRQRESMSPMISQTLSRQQLVTSQFFYYLLLLSERIFRESNSMVLNLKRNIERSEVHCCIFVFARKNVRVSNSVQDKRLREFWKAHSTMRCEQLVVSEHLRSKCCSSSSCRRSFSYVFAAGGCALLFLDISSHLLSSLFFLTKRLIAIVIEILTDCCLELVSVRNSMSHLFCCYC